MQLTIEEQQILSGVQGKAKQLALSVLVDLGELFGAERLIPVSQVHIDTTIYMVDAGVEFAEKLAEQGAVFSVPTQLNPSAIDLLHPEKLRVDPELLEKSRRLEQAYMAMGAQPTWTCAPYQQGIVPRFGEQIGWGESNAIVFANSVLGARTNRYADLMDICIAIIGKTPEFGLHLAENRKADVLVRLVDMPQEVFTNDSFFPLLGFVFGELVGNKIGVVDGIPPDVEVDDLKAFGAAAASSGAVGLFHIVGVTPEAQTLEMCLPERPQQVFEITPAMLEDAEVRLWSAKDTALDLIVLGCPHYSVIQFEKLAHSFEGRQVHSNITFWVSTSRSVYGWIEQSGILKKLEDSGVTVFVDACLLQYPGKSWDFRVAMSDSAKFANYCFSQTGLEVAFGSVEDCVASAVEGKIIRKSLWS